MSLLLDNEFKPLPPDKSVNTEQFLEAVSRLPSFFGECGLPGVGEAGAPRRRLRLLRTFLSQVELKRPRNMNMLIKMDEPLS